MPDVFQDPVVATLKYASSMMRTYNLTNSQAAIHSAAFALYGPEHNEEIAAEAEYYAASSSWDYISSVMEALKRRMQAGVLGTLESTVGVPYKQRAPQPAIHNTLQEGSDDEAHGD